jgi:uncharacterized protein (TIGR02246 family)
MFRAGEKAVQRILFASFFAVALTSASATWSAEKAGSNPQDAAIHKTITDVEDCFSRGDAKGMAALWMTNGEFVGPHGGRIVGREKIEAAFKLFFAAHKNRKLKMTVTNIRLLPKDVVVIDAVSEVTPAMEGLVGEPRSTILLVLSEGRWQIDSMRETVGSVPARYGRLKDLEWLVGDWVNTTGRSAGVTIHSTCDWTANGCYLIRKFSVGEKDGSTLGGTEVIGWDPRVHRIRSWIFESDGSFGDCEWVRDGDRWIVKYEGTLPDGGDVSATHLITRVDADTHSLQSTGRLVNGEERPDTPEITVKRSPVQDKAKPKEDETKLPKQVLPQ